MKAMLKIDSSRIEDGSGTILFFLNLKKRILIITHKGYSGKTSTKKDTPRSTIKCKIIFPLRNWPRDFIRFC